MLKHRAFSSQLCCPLRHSSCSEGKKKTRNRCHRERLTCCQNLFQLHSTATDVCPPSECEESWLVAGIKGIILTSSDNHRLVTENKRDWGKPPHRASSVLMYASICVPFIRIDFFLMRGLMMVRTVICSLHSYKSTFRLRERREDAEPPSSRCRWRRGGNENLLPISL